MGDLVPDGWSSLSGLRRRKQLPLLDTVSRRGMDVLKGMARALGPERAVGELDAGELTARIQRTRSAHTPASWEPGVSGQRNWAARPLASRPRLLIRDPDGGAALDGTLDAGPPEWETVVRTERQILAVTGANLVSRGQVTPAALEAAVRAGRVAAARIPLARRRT